jgi:hypothetical protein
MDTQAAGTNHSDSGRGVPASVSPGHLRALSEVLSQKEKPPAKLELADIQQAVQASPVLAGLSPATPGLIHRGLRNLQLINAENEPTQAYLQLLGGNTDADWKDFIDAHFDYLLHDEVSLLDLTRAELKQRLVEQHPETGQSTLDATARLIRGMMTRSIEQPADEDATRPLPRQKTPSATAPAAPAGETPAARPGSPKAAPARPAPRTPKAKRKAAAPAAEAAPTAAGPATGTASAPTATPDSVAPAAAGSAQSSVIPAATPAVPRRRGRRTPAVSAAVTPAAEAAPEVPLSGSITLPLGGSNAATLSWSLSTLDAQSISVVESQLEIARRFLEAFKNNAS